MRKKKIAIFTGNRAEYGLLYPVIKSISEHPKLEYKLLVSGAHLDSNFGETLKEISKDGFDIYDEIKINMTGKSRSSTPKAIGTGVTAISEALELLNPDLLVVYADRFEGLAAVIAGTQMNIATAHIEGGDLTEGGALDDSVRHAMTKLAHIHFTTNEEASLRILAMGEEPWRVHTVGFTAIDLIEARNYATPAEISKLLKIDINKPIVLFTQHSISQTPELSGAEISQSLDALKKLAEDGVQVIITYPNNDIGSDHIIDSLNKIDSEHRENIILHKSLGRYYYHGILALALSSENQVACVGNSSSGIKETPAFRCPTVNIGTRQEGRLRGQNVIDTGYLSNEIYKATLKCLFDTEFRQICTNGINPYWRGGAGNKIANVLSTLEINESIIRKKMTLKGKYLESYRSDL